MGFVIEIYFVPVRIIGEKHISVKSGRLINIDAVILLVSSSISSLSIFVLILL